MSTPPLPASATAAAPVAPAAPAAPVPAVALPVQPGQTLAARVLAIQAGMVELALAGGRVTAASDLPLEPGQTVRMVVDAASDERVTLRLLPPAAPGADAAPGAAGGSAAAARPALIGAGIPPSTAATLLAALADAGVALPAGPQAAAALAERAAQAGVTTPARAAAFARLEAAGLPTTPAAVAGLAQLAEGPLLGRALVSLIDAAGTPAPGGSATAAADPDGALAAPGRPTPPTPAPTAPLPSAGAVPLGRGVDGQVAQGATAGREPLAGRPLPALAEALARTLAGVEAGAVGGDGEGLRRAVADLGVGLEARLARGSVPDAPPLRALALAIAQHAAAEPALARAAGAVADGIAAQPLAGALPLPAPAAATADPTAGAYLQVPLPGGSTAEIRVRPDAGRDDGGEGRDRPRMLAFLLHLSSLGPVLIEASAGPGGVEATVKAGSDAAREHLARHAAELTDGLRRAAPSARVRVERMDGPAPERLIDPPPASGLDARA